MAGAHYRGVRCPLEGVQVPVMGEPGACHRGVRCPSYGVQVPVIGLVLLRPRPTLASLFFLSRVGCFSGSRGSAFVWHAVQGGAVAKERVRMTKHCHDGERKGLREEYVVDDVASTGARGGRPLCGAVDSRVSGQNWGTGGLARDGARVHLELRRDAHASTRSSAYVLLSGPNARHHRSSQHPRFRLHGSVGN